jgi:hypothetical protein
MEAIADWLWERDRVRWIHRLLFHPSPSIATVALIGVLIADIG